ncbi:DUF5994 family protein [Kitasatospora albolonga]|uniref:DUF5994 family protein n=1 Tax=Kitasatospora albolonga TaxID=68173 RepID=UPI0031EAEC14
MTVTDRATTPATPQSRVRLSLTPDGARAGRLDGAWWPRSHDLALELPSLAAELGERWGRVTRITVNPAQWVTVPRRIPITGHTVHASHTVHGRWFTTMPDQHTVSVRSHLPRGLNLLVVPPRTEAVEAARLMAEAADPANTRSASELLAAEPSIGVPDGRGIAWPVRDPSVSAWDSARWGGPSSLPGHAGTHPAERR